MSDRDRTDNAYRKGKRAFWGDIPLSANPMRARDSQHFWELGWRDEQKKFKEMNRRYQAVDERPRHEDGGDEMNVQEIVEKYLKDNGYDGLFQIDTCCCLLGDGFMPCGGEYFNECEPGYKHEGSWEGYDYTMSSEKPSGKDGTK